jgi:hypothetical protein
VKPGTRKAFDVLSFGLLPTIRFFRKVAQNRRAVRAGKPKPYTPSELVGDALEIVSDAKDQARRD